MTSQYYFIPGAAGTDPAAPETAVQTARLPGRVLVFEESPPVETVMREAFETGAGHLPVVDFRGAPARRADVAPGGMSDLALTQALDATRIMAERCAELPAFAGRPDGAGLQILAAAYVRTGRIEAAWAPETPDMVSYPLLTGLHDPRMRLEDLADAGLLERAFFDVVHQCGSCASARLNVREECPTCHSSQVGEESLIHHYRCAYQGLEREFIAGDQLACPKCRRELRHYGVDYDRPGSVFLCGACGETASDPVVGFACADCGAHTLAEAAARRTWYHYSLTGEGRDALWAGRLPVRSLADTIGRFLPGTLSRSHFAAVVDQQRRIAERYDRPLSGWRLTIASVEGAAADLDSVFSLVAEVTAQEIRDCDSLTVTGDEVKVLMPETDRGEAEIAIDRVRVQLREKISDAVTVSINSVDGAALDELGA